MFTETSRSHHQKVALLYDLGFGKYRVYKLLVEVAFIYDLGFDKYKVYKLFGCSKDTTNELNWICIFDRLIKTYTNYITFPKKKG